MAKKQPPKYTKVRRRSRIETEIPLAIRQDLNRLLLDGITYEDATVWLKAKGYNISKSAVGRYGKDFFETFQNMQRFADQSRVLMSELDDGMPMEEAVGKIILQKVMAALVDGTANITEAPKLISGIASLQTAHVRLNKFKMDLEARTQKALAAVDKIAQKAGFADVDTQALKAVVGSIYGV
jgi:hypothetical protein